MAQKSRLMAITALARDKADIEKPGASIVMDRLKDCQRCVDRNGKEPCKKGTGRTVCEYRRGKNAMKVAIRYLGPEVKDIFGKYMRVLENEMRGEDASGRK